LTAARSAFPALGLHRGGRSEIAPHVDFRYVAVMNRDSIRLDAEHDEAETLVQSPRGVVALRDGELDDPHAGARSRRRECRFDERPADVVFPEPWKHEHSE